MTITDTTRPESHPPEEEPSQAIHDRLRDAIVDRRLAPGTKLTENEVGALFGAGRTVVRAALQMLAYEGLLRIERNRGAFVANPSPEEARHLFAARRLVEPGIATVAAERAGTSEIARLRRHLATEGQHMNEHGPSARRSEIKASGDFHLILAEIGGNGILQRFIEELIARSSLVIALYGRSGVSSCGHDEHAAIVDALEMRDGKAASVLIVSHIDHIEADLDLRARTGPALKEALEL
jgi:DNA-binding GntR family transcriptional regulator